MTLTSLVLGQVASAGHIDGTWVARRDFADLGQWEQSAVVLKLTYTQNYRKVSGTLTYYQPGNNNKKHVIVETIEVVGTYEVKSGSRGRFVATLKIQGTTTDCCHISVNRGKKVSADRQARLVLRLLGARPNGTQKHELKLNCDTPPNDDLMEEEEISDPSDPLDP